MNILQTPLAVVLLASIWWTAPLTQARATDPPRPPAAPAGQTGLALLPALIDASSMPAQIENGRLSGPGADWLRRQLHGTRFVMLGEEHGSAGIAAFSAALWRDLVRDGFDHVAIETDPWVARFAEAQLRADGTQGLVKALATIPGVIPLPFYGWDAEAAFLDTVLRTAPPRRSATLFGLDQVFLGGATPLLADIAREARRPAARALAAELRALSGSKEFLPGIGRQRLPELEALLHDDAPELRKRVTAMRQSGEIYRAFVTDDREAWPANLERESLMKQNLLAALRDAGNRDRTVPRVLFKFGTYHLTRGVSPTLVPTLGSFASAWAEARGERTVHIAVACGPAGRIATFNGGYQSCAADFAGYFGDPGKTLARGSINVIDLRIWKQRPARWAAMPAVGRSIIEGYDVLVVVDGTPASRYLEGIVPPQV